MAFEATKKLQSLRGRGVQTKQFTIGPDNLQVELALINSEEEIEVNTYGDSYEGLSKSVAIKVGILSHAIQSIDGIDVREKMIATGEFTKDGKPRMVQKHMFLREILNSWTPAELDELFKCYATMVPTNVQDSLTLVRIMTTSMLSALAEEHGISGDLVEALDERLNSVQSAVMSGDTNMQERVAEAAKAVEDTTDLILDELKEVEPERSPRQVRAGFAPAKTYGGDHGPRNNQQE